MNREAEIFAEAIELSVSARADYVARACGDNWRLRDTVEALLRGHAKAERVFAEPVAAPVILDLPAEKAGDVIGRYTLLEKIGEGGCGVVWRAEQGEPVRREVALKVIKLGMHTREVITRFEGERQALAMMDHPNIAKVYDGGATENGRPFFVMELVRGVPITRYCDDARLSITARLRLFIDVCRAIQHAHQKGIIHRDLKPSNILVSDGRDSSEVEQLDLKPLSSTGKPAAWGQAAPPSIAPTPKVIDFGIAKATQGRLTDATVFTVFEQFIGTPAYMSPEQAGFNPLDIDTRTDIYSLGVLLYELLTGGPPFDPKMLADGGLEEIRRFIREVDPPRPSTRLNTRGHDERLTLAQHRGVAPSQLSNLIKGDLDWIVMKCLEKTRTRRYETANGLAMDLERHLRNEPVIARPPSRGYLLQKFIRRNRAAVAGVAAATSVLVIGAIISTWQAFRATRAEHEQSRLREAEGDLRRRAEAQELAARRRAYAADIQLAQQALAVDNFVRAQELLDRHKPLAGQLDLRGWEWRYLWQQSRSDAIDTIRTASGGVTSLAVSGDGQSLAVVDPSSQSLSIWHLASRPRREIRLPIQATGRVAFAPRGPLLAATASRTNTQTEQTEYHVALWNVETREVAGEIPTPGLCGGLSFSEDGETLAIAAFGAPAQGLRKDTIMRWRIRDLVRLDTINASFPSPQYVTGFAATRNLKTAAFGTPTRELRVVDLDSGKVRWTAGAAVAEANDVTALAFSHDGKLLASGGGGSDKTIHLWDPATGRLLRRLEGHRNWMTSLLFLPDGETLASASTDRTIRLWDVESGRMLQTLRGHKLDVWPLALLPDNTTLISGGKDGAVCAWDTAARHIRLSSTTLSQPIEAWRFSDDSQSILTVDVDGRVVRWHGIGFREMTPIMELGPLRRPALGIENIVISPDLGHILVRPRGPGSELRLWDTAGRKLRHIFTSSANAMSIPGVFPDNETLIVFDQRDAMSVLCREWDLQSGREKRSWRIPIPDAPKSSLHARVSPDRRTLIMRPNDLDDAMVYDLKTGHAKPVQLAIRGPGAPQFSPDGRLLAIPGMGSAVTKVWETSTYREVATLPTMFMAAPHSAIFSPDGTRLVVGAGGMESIVLWDMESHEALLTLEGTGSFFYRPAFSPDGSWLGARSSGHGGNGILHLWRARSLEEINWR